MPQGLKGKLRQAVEAVVRGERTRISATISLVLCDDETIRDLNARYLGHDYPTDVLSFNLSGAEQHERESGELVGEIIISVETAERNAKRFRQTLERELLRLAIHGVLHLLGYDDATPSQRRRMREKERKYLRLVEATK